MDYECDRGIMQVSGLYTISIVTQLYVTVGYLGLCILVLSPPYMLEPVLIVGVLHTHVCVAWPGIGLEHSATMLSYWEGKEGRVPIAKLHPDPA